MNILMCVQPHVVHGCVAKELKSEQAAYLKTSDIRASSHKRKTNVLSTTARSIGPCKCQVKEEIQSSSSSIVIPSVSFLLLSLFSKDVCIDWTPPAPICT